MKALLLILAMSLCMTALGTDKKPINKDTVIIEIGNGSKMVIMTETLEDLKGLSDYDFNEMISELNQGLDSADKELETLSVTYQTTNNFVQEPAREEAEPVTREAPLEYYGEEPQQMEEQSPTTFKPTQEYYRYYDRHDRDGYEENRSVNVHKDHPGSSSAFQVQLGASNWLENDKFPDEVNANYTVSPWGSWYFAAGVNTKTPIVGVWILEWGLDMSWQIWKMENKRVRISKGEETVLFEEDLTFPAEKSRFNALFFNMSLVPMIDFNYGRSGSGLRFGAGMYGGYRVDSWSKFIYKENGDKVKDKTKSNFYMNNFRYGVRAQIGFKSIDFFANYDLNYMFIDDRGPRLQAISFGVIL